MTILDTGGWKYLWISAALLLLMVVLGYASGGAQSDLLCGRLEIRIDTSQFHFLSERDVESYLLGGLPDPRGTPLFAVNTASVESYLESHGFIRRCEVYPDASGALNIRVEQPSPLFRILTDRGGSCYVARDGEVFDVSSHYTAHVLVVNGPVSLPAAHRLKPVGMSRSELLGLDSVSIAGWLSEQGEPDDEWAIFWAGLYDLVVYLDGDSFWRNQVAQVWVGGLDEVELIPRVGGHRILMGGLEDYEYKLNKLWSLYRAELPWVDLNDYQVLDLRFSDQVVCQRWVAD